MEYFQNVPDCFLYDSSSVNEHVYFLRKREEALI